MVPSYRERKISTGMDEARPQLIATRTAEAIAERKRAGTHRGSRPLVDRSTVEIIVGLDRRGCSLRRIARLPRSRGARRRAVDTAGAIRLYARS